MLMASPLTTASVTPRSGCSEVPDFSAYFSAYFHILSMFAWDGAPSAIEAPQCFIDLGGVEARELLLADEEHGQREEAELHELLSRLRILADVLLGERHALLR